MLLFVQIRDERQILSEKSYYSVQIGHELTNNFVYIIAIVNLMLNDLPQ